MKPYFNIVAFLLLLSLSACNGKGHKSNMSFGEVTYYPDFLWTDDSIKPVTKTFKFDFSQDAKNDKECFAEFAFVDNEGKAIIKEVLRALPMQKEYKIGGYIGESQRTGSNISDSQKTGNIVSGVVDAVACPEFLDTYLNGVWHYAINKGSWEVRSDWDKTPFRDYYAKMKKLSSEMSDDEIRINFIRDSGIEYVRIYKSANPSDWFLSHLTLLASDEKSGECFYKVKPLNKYHPQLKE